MSKLNEVNTFAIILESNDNDLIRKISSRQHVPFNKVNIYNCEKTTFVLYNVDKQYMFNLGATKKLKFIWKDKANFYIIDFSNNTKGDVISNLTFEEIERTRIEGDILIPNLKPEFQELKKIQLVSSCQLDDTHPYLYEHFCIYIENNTLWGLSQSNLSLIKMLRQQIIYLENGRNRVITKW